MNPSLRRRLFAWLSASIVVAGIVAAAISFVFFYDEANELQDAQLTQVAAVLSAEPLPPSITGRPRGRKDAKSRFVIGLLDAVPPDLDPSLEPPLPDTLAPGLQSIEQGGVRWRAIVTQDARGRRFAVAQRTSVRDEDARQAAMLTLLPVLALIPVLLLIVGVTLRGTFAPLVRISAHVDQLHGSESVTLDESGVPREALPLVQAVNRLVRRLAQSMDQQRRLVADAAHELRTPVAALIVQADNVLHVELPPQARQRMAALRHGLARMASLIDQLLSLARVQGAAQPARERIDLGALVRRAIEESLPLAQSKDIDLGCVRADPVEIVGDPFHAYALLRNAVDNAVRYTPSGGTVDVSVMQDGAEACVVVEDTGPGIGADDLERVFEPFTRVLGSKQPGSGLGLAIARTASRALGGTIELRPRDDRGSGLRFVYRQVCA
jgi:signal transduction histidine kinase